MRIASRLQRLTSQHTTDVATDPVSHIADHVIGDVPLGSLAADPHHRCHVVDVIGDVFPASVLGDREAVALVEQSDQQAGAFIYPRGSSSHADAP